MRLVDADKLSLDILLKIPMVSVREETLKYMDEVQKIIRNYPTVKQESIIRCKNCKNKYKYMSMDGSESGIMCRVHKCKVDENDFCSKGEKEIE